MRLWKAMTAVAVLAPLALSGLAPTQASAAETSCADLTVTLSRLTGKSGTSLLTQFSGEVTSAANYGFALADSAAMKVAPSADTGRVAVWRVYNNKTYDFSWAADGADLTAMKNKGYTAQFRQFYGVSAKSTCTSAVYRLTKDSVTQLALGEANRDSLVKAGWVADKSAAFYAAPGKTTQPIVPPVTKPVPPVTNGSKSPTGGAATDSKTETTFSIGVIPDTQREVWTDSDTRFKNRSEWLVANAQSLNMKFVTHVGDVVDWGDVTPAQYTRAQAALAPLKGKIPYALTIGNHDTAAVCKGGSACPGKDASITVRDTSGFNKAFPLSSFTSVKGQYEAGKVDNTYSTFTAGGQKWMMLNLELWPRQGAIDWAKKVVAANPDHNVIVSTHAYLNADGSIGGSNGGYGSTSPKHLYDSLIKVYPNIKMVLSGHTGSQASRVDTGVNGNKILSLLQCFHSETTNPVRIVKFDVAKGSVTTSVYAPYTKATILADQTFTGFDFKN